MRSSFLVAFVLMAPSAAAQPGMHVLDALPGSSLTIRGSTTVGARWSCHAANVESRVAVLADSIIPAVRGVSVYVPVRALRCQSSLMERSMRHALRADRDTAALYMRGVFEIYDERPQSREEPHLAGALKVAGVERNVFLKATVHADADGVLTVHSLVPLTLSEFRVEPPRVLWGAVRARDAITVEVDLRYPAMPVVTR